eukprot:TRINITY_DN2676_c0_g1_i6.p1 TRINITY_DN2676_c0_g1~~TRINITY_DN2676_c0_g1_i6.p1  ORF type:complete len:577 (-),score=119.31 TRINITY_DN2676_c0_g1_i6:3089-4819(-)
MNKNLLLWGLIVLTISNCLQCPDLGFRKITFCDTTKVTRNLPHTYFNCLRDNELKSVLYAGSCECPNNCNYESNFGQCSNGKCQCNKGYTGKDCGLPTSDNNCNGKGQFTNGYCLCNDGYSGRFCEVNNVQLPRFPVVFQDNYWNDKYGENHPLFLLDSWFTYDVVMNEKDLLHLLDPIHMNDRIYYPAKLTMVGPTGTVVKDYNVGIRLRGMSTRGEPKKSWKISFTKFGSDSIFDQKSINLNGQQNDFTHARDPMATEILRTMGVPAPRTGHAELRINDINYGSFILAESINSDFTNVHLKKSKGDRYKCRGGASFSYISNDPKKYQDQTFTYMNITRQLYELQDHASSTDYKDLRDLIVAIHNNPLIDQYLNVDLFLRAFSAYVMTGNWDSYPWNANNIQIFRDKKSQIFNWLAFDCDTSFGFDQLQAINGAIDWSTIDIYSWQKYSEQSPTKGKRPLAELCMQNPDYRNAYSKWIIDLIKNGPLDINRSEFKDRVQLFKDKMLSVLKRDYQNLFHYGLQFDDIDKYYDVPFTRHIPNNPDEIEVVVRWGMNEFFKNRYYSAVKQLKENGYKF